MLAGCEWHGQARTDVVSRWNDASQRKAISGHTIVVCLCCDGPALATARPAYDEAGNALDGGVCDATRCTRCQDCTPEQEAELIARLNEGAEVTA